MAIGGTAGGTSAERRLEAELEAAADEIPNPMELFEKLFTPEMKDRAVRCTNARAAMLCKLIKFAQNLDLLEHADPTFQEALARPAWIKANNPAPPRASASGNHRPRRVEDVDGHHLLRGAGETAPRARLLVARHVPLGLRRAAREGHRMSRRRYEIINAMLLLQTREEERRARSRDG